MLKVRVCATNGRGAGIKRSMSVFGVFRVNILHYSSGPFRILRVTAAGRWATRRRSNGPFLACFCTRKDIADA